MVIVQMIVRDVREHGPGEMQPFGAVLHEAVRADLHKAVLAPPIDHLGHHPVEPDAVGSRVRRLAPLGVDAVRHRRDQADLIAEAPEQAVQQRRGRRLAVGPRHADQPERPARVAIESGRHASQRDRRVGDAQIGYSLGQPRGHRLADDRDGPRPDGRLDESMPVRLRASRSENSAPGVTRLESNSSDETFAEQSPADSSTSAAFKRSFNNMPCAFYPMYKSRVFIRRNTKRDAF